MKKCYSLKKWNLLFFLFLINYCVASNGVDVIDFTSLPLAKGVTYIEAIGFGSITEVKSNTLPPPAGQVTIESTNGLNLDCNNPQTTLIAWVDGQIANNVVWTRSVVWNQAGEYYGTANPMNVVNFSNGLVYYGVTYTDGNGSISTAEIIINMWSQASPITIDAMEGVDLNCNITNTTLWPLIGGFYAGDDLVWTLGGEYYDTQNILLVDNVFEGSFAYGVSYTDEYGCSSSDEVVVNVSFSVPYINIYSLTGFDLNCNNSQIELLVGIDFETTTDIVDWYQGTNYLGTSNSIVVTNTTNGPVEYNAVYTAPNGCATEDRIYVNMSQPAAVSIESSAGLDLTCNNPLTQLTAWVNGGVASNVVWTQAGEYYGTGNPIDVVNFTNGPVTYGVTYTDENGCSTTDEVVINMWSQASPITIDAMEGVDLNCNITNTTLWPLIGGFYAGDDLVWTLGGEYYDTQNILLVDNVFEGSFAYGVSYTDEYGCSSSDEVVVNVSLSVPNIYIYSLTGNDLNCNNSQIELLVEIMGNETSTNIIDWYQGTNYLGTANSIVVTNTTNGPVQYDAVYTAQNGCPTGSGIVVNMSQPAAVSIESSAGLDLTCNNPLTQLTAWVNGGVASNVVWTQAGEYYGTGNPIDVVNFTNGPVTYGVTYTDENGCSTTDEVVINMSNYAAATNIYQNVSPDFSATYLTSSGSNIINHTWEITAFDFNEQAMGTPISSNQSTAVLPSIIGVSYVITCLNAEFLDGCTYNICDTIEVASGNIYAFGQLICETNIGGYYAPDVPVIITNLNTGYSISSITDGSGHYNYNIQTPDQPWAGSIPGLPGDSIRISIDPNYLLNMGYQGVNPTLNYLGYDVNSNSEAIDTTFTLQCTNFNPFPVLCYEGNVFCDSNGDGIQNFGETPLVNAPITIDNYQGGSTTAITVYSDTIGYFHYCGAIFGVTDSAQATLSSTWLANNGYTMSNNDNVFYIYGDTLASSQPLSIPVQCNNVCTDLWTTVTPWVGYFQNQTAVIKLNWGNYGPEAANYSLQLTWPQGVTIQPASIQYPNYVISGNTITWNLGSINPGFNNTDIIYFNVPFGLADGTQHVFNSIITPSLVSDCYNENNDGGLLQILGNSYDPNDKNVYRKTFHENEISGFSESDINFGEVDELEYTVRFQNTGTAPAQNIYIMDTLDAELDWSTFELIQSTHEVEVENFGNGVLRFKYNNIWLPDSSESQELSQGHFVFRMRENSGNTLGSEITNTAYIYFDWNPAIVTNTTYNINDWIEFVGEENAFNVQAFPNPMNNELTLKVEGKFNYEIHDLTGRKLLQGIGVSQTTINTESLATGTYLISVYVNGAKQTGKVVKY